MGKRIFLFVCLLFLIILTGYIHYIRVHAFDPSIMFLSGCGLMVCSGIVTNLPSKQDKKDLYVCKVCWLISTPRTRTKGSPSVEDVLWFVFIVPGMLYSLWRHISKDRVCPVCSSTDIVPIDSKKGQSFFDKIYSNKNTRYISKLLSYNQEDFVRNDYQKYEGQCRARDQGM